MCRDGRKAEDLSGQLLSVPAAKGEKLAIVRKGETPAAVKML